MVVHFNVVLIWLAQMVKKEFVKLLRVSNIKLELPQQTNKKTIKILQPVQRQPVSTKMAKVFFPRLLRRAFKNSIFSKSFQ